MGETRHLPEGLCQVSAMSLRSLSTSVRLSDSAPTFRDAWTLRVIVAFFVLFLGLEGGSFVGMALSKATAPFLAWVVSWQVPGIQPYILTAFVFSLGVATVWAVIDRRRQWERSIYQIGQLLARSTLFHTMLR